MMADDSSGKAIGELVAAPISALIAAVGKGMAEAQQAMDLATIETLKSLYSGEDKTLNLMRQFGFQPTWYRIPELDAELTVSMSLGVSGEKGEAGDAGGSNGALKLFAAPIDASYVNKYGFDLKATSTVRFKVVPIPASPEAADVKIVPRLVDKTFGKARALLEELGIPYRLENEKIAPLESTQVLSTKPAAGEVLRRKQHVILTMK
jgi:hypothetical protein